MICAKTRCLRLLGALAFTTWLSLPVLASGNGGAASGDHPIIDITFGQILLLLTNLGIGGVYFHFLLRKDARATKLEDIVTQQQKDAEQTAKMIADAMKSLGDAVKTLSANQMEAETRAIDSYRALAKEMRDAILLDVQGNAELKQMMKELLHRPGGAARGTTT